jgi:acid phosphatase family membrane protein YuiD
MELNPYIVIPLIAWFLAQWVKFSIAAFKDDINFRYLYASGGMPSVHSAVVTSLFVTTLLLQGSMSPLAGITAILAAIVIYDSLGVRRSTGDQAIVLNALVDGLEEQKIAFNSNVTRVREVLGHKPKEVFWGVVLGALVAIVANAEKLTKQIDFLTTIPKDNELYIYMAVLASILVVVVAMIVLYRKRWKAANNATGSLVAWLTVAGVFGGAFVMLAASQAVATLGARWAVYGVFALLAVMLMYVVRSIMSLPAKTQPQVADRKSRWLEKSKKKKRKK